MPTAGPADDAAIREKAYLFWEEDGRPEGRETEYWMRAVVALTDKTQLKELTEPAPRKAAKTKAAASKTKASPVKAEPAKKPKKK